MRKKESDNIFCINFVLPPIRRNGDIFKNDSPWLKNITLKHQVGIVFERLIDTHFQYIKKRLKTYFKLVIEI